MSSQQLDQVVKGAALPGLFSLKVAAPEIDETSPLPQDLAQQDDPLASLPSSPDQIYLNLLILEASLRSQYLLLRARRRQNTFFLFLLALWNAFFFYALFLQPREDGSGIGGSVYWVVDMAEKLALMGGVVTGILLWGTGQWERGVRWPRRFVAITNRGLRTMNCKIVVLKGPWWRELLSYFSFLVPHPSLQPMPGSGYRFVETSREKRSHGHAKHLGHEESGLLREEDLAPGGDYIKLLLLPKPFSPEFRQEWENYRAEYWEKENERRASLLHQLKEQERQRAREERALLGWTGLFGRNRPADTIVRDHEAGRSHLKVIHEKDGRMGSSRKLTSHSREPSRSSTPGEGEADGRPPSRSMQRMPTGGVADGKRRTRASLAGAGQQHGGKGRTYSSDQQVA